MVCQVKMIVLSSWSIAYTRSWTGKGVEIRKFEVSNKADVIHSFIHSFNRQ